MAEPDGTTTSVSLIGHLTAGADWDEAWATFVDMYGPMIRGWCRGFGLQGDDAADIAAGVLLRLVERIGTYRRVRDGVVHPFRPWLRAVVENAVRDRLRQEKRRHADRGRGGETAAVDLLPTRVPAPDGDRVVGQLVDALSQYLDDEHVRAFRAVRARHHVTADDGSKTPTRSWTAYEMLCIREGTVGEVAAALGMTPAAVSTAAYRVKRELNAEYEKYCSTSGEEHGP